LRIAVDEAVGPWPLRPPSAGWPDISTQQAKGLFHHIFLMFRLTADMSVRPMIVIG
jgi:hypothetical protein